MIKKTVCELFAGVGGFRVGLNGKKNNNGWDFVWANQWEPGKKNQHAFNCYTSHFGDSPNHVNEDISKIDVSTIPDHSLLVGGFPCQDYSVARTKAEGIQGHKGVLWWEINKILKEKRPPFLLLENVDRLLKSPAKQRGRDFGIMLYSLNQLGYAVEWRVINAADYGFPQKRRRVFIFAFHKDTNYYNKLTNSTDRMWLERDGFFQQEFPATYLKDNRSILLDSFKDIVDISDNFNFQFKNSGFLIDGDVHTMELKPMEIEMAPLKNIVLNESLDERYFIDSKPEKMDKFQYLKGPKKIKRTDKSGFEYFYSEGGMNFPDDLNSPGRTMLTSESSVNRSTHIIKDPKTGRLRTLTPIECERLNGFPYDWTNTGMPESFRYFCMGNALVVGLVEKMGRTISEIFETEESFPLKKEVI